MQQRSCLVNDKSLKNLFPFENKGGAWCIPLDLHLVTLWSCKDIQNGTIWQAIYNILLMAEHYIRKELSIVKQNCYKNVLTPITATNTGTME